MNTQELKFELLKLVHRPGVSPIEILATVSQYAKYIQEATPPNTPDTATKGGGNKIK
jgi:hypothetical protein